MQKHKKKTNCVLLRLLQNGNNLIISTKRLTSQYIIQRYFKTFYSNYFCKLLQYDKNIMITE